MTGVDTPVSTTAGAAVSTAVTTGDVVAFTQSNPTSAAATSLTSAVGGPMVSVLPSTQIQMQALQVALQAAQNATGGLLNTSVPQDVQQVPIFSPGMAVPGPFNLLANP